MLENVSNIVGALSTAPSGRVRTAILKMASADASKEISDAMEKSHAELIGVREGYRSASESYEEAGKRATEAKTKVESHVGGYSFAGGVAWLSVGLAALVGEAVLNHASLPYILSIESELEGWALTIAATLGALFLHPLVDPGYKLADRDAKLLFRIPVAVSYAIALCFIFLIADGRGAALAFALDPTKTQVNLQPEQISRAFKALALGVGCWAGTCSFLASRNFQGYSLVRAAAHAARALIQTQREHSTAKAAVEIAEYRFQQVEETAREQAEAALARVSLELSIRDSTIGTAEDEINRNLAQHFNGPLSEVSTPDLPEGSRWRKIA